VRFQACLLPWSRIKTPPARSTRNLCHYIQFLNTEVQSKEILHKLPKRKQLTVVSFDFNYVVQFMVIRIVRVFSKSTRGILWTLNKLSAGLSGDLFAIIATFDVHTLGRMTPLLELGSFPMVWGALWGALQTCICGANVHAAEVVQASPLSQKMEPRLQSHFFSLNLF